MTEADRKASMARHPSNAERRDFTADGVRIKVGLCVWNNDLQAVIVLKHHDDGWYDTTLHGYSNGERMATRHPRTHQLASEALRAAETDLGT